MEDSHEEQPQGYEQELQELLGDMKQTYPMHSGLEPRKRVENDVLTNFSKITYKAEVWVRRKAETMVLGSLFQRGFEKLAELYPEDEQRDIVREHVNEKIRSEARSERDTGRPSLIKKLIEENKGILGIEDVD